MERQMASQEATDNITELQRRSRLLSILGELESVIYYVTMLILISAAGILLVVGFYHFVININANLYENVLQLLQSLLLVMMLMEILHTVDISISRHQLIADPFLVVGIIAAIRRMLVVTVELEQPGAVSSQSDASLFLWELGILALVTLILSICIYIIRSKREFP